jgi:hypothetical protein
MEVHGTHDRPEFHLSSHEVMRGIKVKNGRLVMRPYGPFQFGTIADLVVGLVTLCLVIMADRVSSPWLLVAGFLLAVAVDAVGRLRVQVVADEEYVHVRNKWRTRHVPLVEVLECRSDVVRWQVKAPWFIGRRSRNPSFSKGELWLVGMIVTTGGRTVKSDALIGFPDPIGLGGDPTLDPTVDCPVAMKVAALARWCSVPHIHVAAEANSSSATP